MSEAIQNTDRKKVLVVDDEKDIREALFTALAAEGYEVFAAEDGKKGFDLALEKKPDLIFLDLSMPNMNGHEVLDALREDEWGKNANVVVLTASADMDTLSVTLAKGGHDYMVKSHFELHDIVKKAKERLEDC